MRKLSFALAVCAGLGITACLGSGGGNGQQGAGVGHPESNRDPRIEGTSPRSVLQGEQYEFTPTAADADGDMLAFQISGKPAWASFDPANGQLWGTPGVGDAGSYANIQISVADGQASDALTGFSITVAQAASGSATLSWNPPTQNADGSTLRNLAGFRIYYGRKASALDKSIAVNNPGLTRYVVENLSTAKWYFAMTSVNAKGSESKRSKVISKNVA